LTKREFKERNRREWPSFDTRVGSKVCQSERQSQNACRRGGRQLVVFGRGARRQHEFHQRHKFVIPDFQTPDQRFQHERDGDSGTETISRVESRHQEHTITTSPTGIQASTRRETTRDKREYYISVRGFERDSVSTTLSIAIMIASAAVTDGTLTGTYSFFDG